MAGEICAGGIAGGQCRTGQQHGPVVKQIFHVENNYYLSLKGADYCRETQIDQLLIIIIILFLWH